MTSRMANKYELTKSIEARKLNPRTGVPLGDPWITIPYGAILENVVDSKDMKDFWYLGERYQGRTEELQGALKAL